MRTYLIDDEKNEIVIDLTKTIRHSSELLEFEFSSLENQELIKKQRIFVRKLGRQYFVSEDNQRWKKLARQEMPGVMLNKNIVYKLYRGYKPSGLSAADGGNLSTQMPGKVIKILKQVGEKVEKNTPLIILEAMKMENEIKSSIDGIIEAIHVKEGDNLEQGVLMIEIRDM